MLQHRDGEGNVLPQNEEILIQTGNTPEPSRFATEETMQIQLEKSDMLPALVENNTAEATTVMGGLNSTKHRQQGGQFKNTILDKYGFVQKSNSGLVGMKNNIIFGSKKGKRKKCKDEKFTKQTNLNSLLSTDLSKRYIKARRRLDNNI